jgi:hypothetical protein
LNFARLLIVIRGILNVAVRLVWGYTPFSGNPALRN